MPDAAELVRTIKRAARDAARAEKPVEVCAGTVTSADPLEIRTEQKLTLGRAQLALSRNVTDFETEVSIKADYGWETQESSGGDGDAAYGAHGHGIVIDGLKIKVHNALKAGDRVILARQQGGQKYTVLDRVGE